MAALLLDFAALSLSMHFSSVLSTQLICSAGSAWGRFKGFWNIEQIYSLKSIIDSENTAVRKLKITMQKKNFLFHSARASHHHYDKVHVDHVRQGASRRDSFVSTTFI